MKLLVLYGLSNASVRFVSNCRREGLGVISGCGALGGVCSIAALLAFS